MEELKNLGRTFGPFGPGGGLKVGPKFLNYYLRKELGFWKLLIGSGRKV